MMEHLKRGEKKPTDNSTRIALGNDVRYQQTDASSFAN